MDKRARTKVLIFIVAYNAEKTIVEVVERIPRELEKNYDLSLLIIDDCSSDNTFFVIKEYLLNQKTWINYSALRNPTNQGYGGNQKIGYHYAIENSFDVVVLLHGDGQYAPECLPSLLSPFTEATPADVVFGSRMLSRKGALQGGMPL